MGEYHEYPRRSLSMLQDFQIQARRRLRSHLSGGHLVRRRGLSLDFHDYARYSHGDDVRHIDWLQSLRYGKQQGQTIWENWVVRRFVSEEHLRLVISIDTRDTMRYPVAMAGNKVDARASISKLQMARWLAEALSIVALRSGDRVFLTGLFNRPDGKKPSLLDLRAAMRHERSLTAELNQVTKIPSEAELKKLATPSPEGETFNQQIFSENCLHTAAVWIIISDFYFDAGKADVLLNLIRRAQDGMRWVMLIDLDSWPYETYQMGLGGRRVTGPQHDKGYEVAIDEAGLQIVQNAINANKEKVFRFAEHSHWEWEAEYADQNAFISFFERKFMDDDLLKSLFMRDA